MASISVGASLGVRSAARPARAAPAAEADGRWGRRDKVVSEAAWPQANFMQRIDFPDVDAATASLMVPHILGAKGAKISAASRASNSRLTLRYGKSVAEKNNIVIIGTTQLRVEHGARLAKELLDDAVKLAQMQRKSNKSSSSELKRPVSVTSTTPRPMSTRQRAQSLPSTTPKKPVARPEALEIISDSELSSESDDDFPPSAILTTAPSMPKDTHPEVVDVTDDDPVGPAPLPPRPPMVSIATDTSQDAMAPATAYHATLQHLQHSIASALESADTLRYMPTTRGMQRSIVASKRKLAALQQLHTWHQIHFRYPKLPTLPVSKRLGRATPQELRARMRPEARSGTPGTLPTFLAPLLQQPKHKAQWLGLRHFVPTYVPYSFLQPIRMTHLTLHALRDHMCPHRSQYIAQYNILATSIRSQQTVHLEYLMHLCCALRQLVCDQLAVDEWRRRGYVEPMEPSAPDLFGQHTSWKLQVNRRICRSTALHPIVQPLLVDTCASFPFLWSVLSVWTTDERANWKTPLEDAGPLQESVRTVLKTNIGKLDTQALLTYEGRVHSRVHDYVHLLSRNMLRRWQHLFTMHPELTLIAWWERDGAKPWFDEVAPPTPASSTDSDDDVVDVTPVASASTLANLHQLLAKCQSLAPGV
ncbi:hypothetical protein SPRG_08066 [Saprolegnia parasitica CBS 223.65]|uniref:K Homology domain-containing protein n=1 Tax=Saprolegnia parasitica (strain CBS 223.65) TaxID=695850 RepID=A0A067C7N9_SAPPC|nr:hypothetical protein SPRG_08066 [Saprolegnia parasitica CBS 223.65]KDO26764.1 hypothetical protein SPRG_08066 [Saprolegnia parasitica CBS 223.65]|eukprot:XP_012202425.1 hypothetical protein SPRG_08066 [Saprolegnia parasitica CBS 223.65]